MIPSLAISDLSADWTLCLLNPQLDLGRGALLTNQFLFGFGDVPSRGDEEGDETCPFSRRLVEVFKETLHFQFFDVYFGGHWMSFSY